MAATLRDVARLAGVSTSTASRALASSGLVNGATRVRVEQAAGVLGYAPNKAARGLITGRTGNFGLVVPDLANPFFPSVVKGVQARARAADVAVFVADTDEDAAAETGLVRALAQQVDGLILCSPRTTDDELLAVAAETTVVLVNRLVPGIGSVVFDHDDGMWQALAHLAVLGHRRIAWIGGPATSWSGAQRAAGLAGAAAELGVELIDAGHCPPHYEGGLAAADRAVATGATAVVAYNDLVALGVLARLHARGISVPGRLSVVGIDDIAMARMAHPALTTVSLPKHQAGRAAVELLLGLTLHGAAPKASSTDVVSLAAVELDPPRRTLPGELMVRESTAEPPTT